MRDPANHILDLRREARQCRQTIRVPHPRPFRLTSFSLNPCLMLESAIHQILSESTLPAQLPLNRIVTGTAMSDATTIPYATIEITKNKNAYRSNQSTIERAIVGFTIWDEEHSRGATLREAIIAIFDNQHFTTDSANIMVCRKQSDSAKPGSNGIWQFAIEIEFVFQSSG